jgi:hypothetical protein
MASFLDNIFPSSPDDPRYAANMALFAGMMKGDFGGGAQAFADVLQRGKAQQLQSQLGQLNLQKGQLEVNDLQRKLADDQAARDVIREESTRRAIGTTPQGSLGSGSYGIAEPPQTGATMGASGAPAQPTSGPPASSRNNVWQLYQRMGDALAAKGLTAQSQSYYQLAEKFRPKYGTEPRVMTDPATGKLVQVLVSEDGSTNVLPFGVKPNMKMENLGDRTVAIDENALNNGQTFQRGLSPDSVYSGSITMRGQNMADSRAREANASGRIPAGYRQLPDGTLTYIKGGPADPEAAKRAAPTEFQGKAAMFGARAQQADKIIGELTGQYSPSAINAKTGVGNTPLIGGVLEPAANLMLSANDQRVEQAQRDFVNAVLRLESGAAISQSEFDNARKQYFPQPGDSQAVITQKARNRQTAISGLMANARPGTFDSIAAPAAAPRAAASPFSPDAIAAEIARRSGQ